MVVQFLELFSDAPAGVAALAIPAVAAPSSASSTGRNSTISNIIEPEDTGAVVVNVTATLLFPAASWALRVAYAHLSSPPVAGKDWPAATVVAPTVILRTAAAADA